MAGLATRASGRRRPLVASGKSGYNHPALVLHLQRGDAYMSYPSVPTSESQVQQFTRAALRAILRAEAGGRLPPRFTSSGQPVWDAFRNELTTADLVALAIQDTGSAMAVPFDPVQWWPDWPDWALLQLPPDDAQGWIREAMAAIDAPRDQYLRELAAVAGVDLPPDELIAELSTPARHERWLELPGTGGWVAYSLCSRPDAGLYLWENFSIICIEPQEMLLAGLIAWELGAPPRTELPIWLDDTHLSATLGQSDGQKYHGVVGRRRLHNHRDLRVLHREGKLPLWI